MKKTALFAAAAVLALSAGGAASAAGAPGLSTKGMNIHATRPNVPSAGLTTLFSQTSNDSGIAIVSQMFGTSFPTYDDQGADDFKVPAGKTWVVKEVDITGVYFNGTGLATGENISFYAAGKGTGKTLPGAQVGATQTIKGKDNGTGSFTIKLKTPVKLKGGKAGKTYWLSAQAIKTFNNGNGEWGWENQSTTEGNAAAWQNPGGGFGTPCTTWMPEHTCIASSPGDHIFVLKGKTN